MFGLSDLFGFGFTTLGWNWSRSKSPRSIGPYWALYTDDVSGHFTVPRCLKYELELSLSYKMIYSLFYPGINEL